MTDEYPSHSKTLKHIVCTGCGRIVESSVNVRIVLIQRSTIYCKECSQLMVPVYLDTCRYHNTLLLNGYCDICVNNELKDNQV